MIRKNLKISSLIFCFLIDIFFQKKISSEIQPNNFEPEINTQYSSNIEWEKINEGKQYESNIIWEKSNSIPLKIENYKLEKTNKYLPPKLGSLGRSIVFDNSIVGPDISWIIPPGLAWNKKYKFDFLARGHNTKIPNLKQKTFLRGMMVMQ